MITLQNIIDLYSKEEVTSIIRNSFTNQTVQVIYITLVFIAVIIAYFYNRLSRHLSKEKCYIIYIATVLAWVICNLSVLNVKYFITKQSTDLFERINYNIIDNQTEPLGNLTLSDEIISYIKTMPNTHLPFAQGEAAVDLKDVNFVEDDEAYISYTKYQRKLSFLDYLPGCNKLPKGLLNRYKVNSIHYIPSEEPLEVSTTNIYPLKDQLDFMKIIQLFKQSNSFKYVENKSNIVTYKGEYNTPIKVHHKQSTKSYVECTYIFDGIRNLNQAETGEIVNLHDTTDETLPYVLKYLDTTHGTYLLSSIDIYC